VKQINSNGSRNKGTKEEIAIVRYLSQSPGSRVGSGEDTNRLVLTSDFQNNKIKDENKLTDVLGVNYYYYYYYYYYYCIC
jgi:hypothetical protein